MSLFTGYDRWPVAGEGFCSPCGVKGPQHVRGECPKVVCLTCDSEGHHLCPCRCHDIYRWTNRVAEDSEDPGQGD